MDLVKIKKHVEEKKELYKSQGRADKEFEKKINGKNIKIWLPNSVFDQQKMMMLGEEIMNTSKDFDTNFELTSKFYREVCKYLMVDSNLANPELLELSEIKAYSMLYYVELLLPLSLWGDMVADEILS
jgi:hypothetical protein